MTFTNISWLPFIIIIALIWVWLIIRYKNNFFRVLSENWFFKQSKWNFLQTALFVIGSLGLLLSTLDLRGPEDKIESDIPDQKTIIIIDSSLSMLVEDVRPNRYKKSLIMARHFIKRSVGHKIALVLFSDTQKRLIPFTDDIDLLDSRVAALESVNVQGGGSEISQSILESIQYFKIEAKKNEEVRGNILLFTDSEESTSSFQENIPKEISLAIVGVGTRKGGKIPLRSRDGVFRGYKKHQGQEVISKLNENFLKKFKKISQTYKYWVASSYSIPTEEILFFFKQTFVSNLSKGSTRVRPVMGHYILIPSVLFLIFSFIFSHFKPYKRIIYLILILIFFVVEVKVEAQDEVEEEIKLSRLTLEGLSSLKKGELNREKKLVLARELLNDKATVQSELLYRENLDEKVDEIAVLNNFAISLIKNKNSKEALEVFKSALNIAKSKKIDEKTINEIRQNILLALATKKQNSKGKGKDSEKNKKENDSEKKDDKSGQNKSDGNKKDEKNKNNNKNKENEKKEKKEEKEEKESESDNRDKNNKKEKSEEPKPKTMKEKEDEIRKKRKMVKIPALIKQIMSTDRNIQKKYMDTKMEKNHGSAKKDW